MYIKNIRIYIFMSKNIFEVVNIDYFELDFYLKSSFKAKKVWTSLSQKVVDQWSVLVLQVTCTLKKLTCTFLQRIFAYVNVYSQQVGELHRWLGTFFFFTLVLIRKSLKFVVFFLTKCRINKILPKKQKQPTMQTLPSGGASR